jgi:hypothetical protein
LFFDSINDRHRRSSTANEYEYRFTEYRFAEYEYDEIRCDERPFLQFSDLNLEKFTSAKTPASENRAQGLGIAIRKVRTKRRSLQVEGPIANRQDIAILVPQSNPGPRADREAVGRRPVLGVQAERFSIFLDNGPVGIRAA